MKFAAAVSLIWIVTTVTAMPSYHIKSHHKHSKSRDLSNNPFQPEELAEDGGTGYENTLSNDSPPPDKINSALPMKSWSPTHEDYASNEYPDLFEEEIQDDLLRPPKKHTSIPYDPCQEVFCHYGRVCRALPDGSATCECANASFCTSHHKRVCGSDGVWYSSHCELHRQACIKYRHIQIDHSTAACDNTPHTNEDQSEESLAFAYEEIDRKQIDERQNPDLTKLQNTKSVQQEQGEKQDGTIQDGVIPTRGEERRDRMYDVPEIRCSETEYERLKQNLLEYHCARVAEDNCFSNAASKQFVVNIMFNYYDRSSDSLLDVEELRDVEERDHLAQLSNYCGLTDMLHFDDADTDQNITLHEFYQAFEVSLVHLEERLRVFTTAVTTGNSIELKCAIKGASEIVWKRNGGALDGLPNDEITVFQDGSLYIGHIGLHHLGNYSCQDRYNDDVTQTHVLRVQMIPVVEVSPSTQFHSPGTNMEVKCRANGVPEPRLTWERNEQALLVDPQHYTLLYGNATLEIHSASYTKDTGAYKCIAKNSAGTSQDIATVFIEDNQVPTNSGHGSREQFIVFHDSGYTVYDPAHCYMDHQVSGSFSKFAHTAKSLSTLCEEGKPCAWGSAVSVKSKFVYVSQPTLNRIVVVALDGSNNPVKIIKTDATPVKVTYVEHLDQVWIVCWNGPQNAGSNTLMVIRDVSDSDEAHVAMHIEPASQSFNFVDALFLPERNDLENKLNFGYVTRQQQQTLYKLDLNKLKFVNIIDLHEYECVPKSVAMVPLGGQVMVYCTSPDGNTEKNARLVLDFITDQVLGYIDLDGEPHVSPDGRKLVSVDRASNTLSVYSVTDAGKLEHVFDEYTSFHMSTVAFYPSERERGYDLYATSSDRNDLLYVNLASGKIEIIEGVGEPMERRDCIWSEYNRVIVSGRAFAEYLISPSKDSVFIIDGRRRHVQCEWQEITHGNVVVRVQPQRVHH